MLRREEEQEPNSCFNRALPHEKIFVLLGRDPCAAQAVRFWANERIKRGLNKTDDAQIQEAYKCADEMQLKRTQIREDVKAFDRVEGEVSDHIDGGQEPNLDDPHAMSAANAEIEYCDCELPKVFNSDDKLCNGCGLEIEFKQ